MAPVYISSDMGPLGLGCAAPTEANDQHLLEDCVALIQHPRAIPGAETAVDAFYFTSLRPAAATILLNVESDDYGVVEDRPCGCPFDELGYRRHMRGIRSYGKLTGEGVTLVGSDMTKILEESLPQRFGGSPLDYQLVEEENEQGLGRLVLLVNPKVDIPDEQQVIDAVLEELGQGSESAGIAGIFWKQANTLRVRRQEPGWTSRGKLSGLQRSRGAASRSAAPVSDGTTPAAEEPERKVGA